MKIEFYAKANECSPIIEDIQKLSAKDKAKVLGCLQNVEEIGFNSHRVIFRQVRGELWEIKINLESGGFRLFYVTLNADTLIVLHSYKKKSQKIPNTELEMAEKRMMEVLSYEQIH
jgi:phage-related protein